MLTRTELIGSALIVLALIVPGTVREHWNDSAPPPAEVVICDLPSGGAPHPPYQVR